MNDTLYPRPAKAFADKRRDLAPDVEAVFQAFSEAVFREGALPRKTKQPLTSRNIPTVFRVVPRLRSVTEQRHRRL